MQNHLVGKSMYGLLDNVEELLEQAQVIIHSIGLTAQESFLQKEDGDDHAAKKRKIE